MGDNEFVVVANRLPVDKVGDHYEVSPGGLVAALAPVLRAREGCWVGWPGVADAAPEPFRTDAGVLLTGKADPQVLADAGADHVLDGVVAIPSLLDA